MLCAGGSCSTHARKPLRAYILYVPSGSTPFIWPSAGRAPESCGSHQYTNQHCPNEWDSRSSDPARQWQAFQSGVWYCLWPCWVSLDVENETLIQTALSRLIADKTVLVIAHRMRTVAGADKIVVLSDGTVAEEGSPKDLEEKNGVYTHMVKLQTESQNWKLAWRSL